MQLAEAMAVAMQMQNQYLAYADAKDSASAARHLASATLNFDGTKVSGHADIEAHYAKLWAPAEGHSHFASNFRIEASDDHQITWVCNYQRFAITSDGACLTTLGEYRGTAGLVADHWEITSLEVHRRWHRG